MKLTRKRKRIYMGKRGGEDREYDGRKGEGKVDTHKYTRVLQPKIEREGGNLRGGIT